MRRLGFTGASRLGRYLLAALSGMVLFGTPSAMAQDDESNPWSIVRSRHFDILTDAPPEPVVEIALNLERFREAFSRLSPSMSLRSPIPVRVIAFRDHASYAPYKVPSDPRILGQFIRDLDGHFLTFHAGASAAYAVDYHEYVHYLVDSNLSGIPRWFNEGLAEYYSTFATDGNVVTLGRPVDRHIRWILKDTEQGGREIHHDFSLVDVLTNQAAHEAEKVGGFYAFSWAVVHYLLSDDGRVEQTADFLARLGNAEALDDAFKDAFGMEIDELEADVRAYVSRGDFQTASFRVSTTPDPPQIDPIQPADVLVQLGDLSGTLGRVSAARRHYEAAQELKPNHPEALSGLAWLHGLENSPEKARYLHQEAVRLGSQEPLTFLRYGHHFLTALVRDSNEALLDVAMFQSTGANNPGPVTSILLAESLLRRVGDDSGTHSAAGSYASKAFKAYRKALSFDRDHAGAQLYFAASHLFLDAELKPALRAVAKVRRWMPQNRDLAFLQLQLHLKDGGIEAAERILEQDIGHVDPDLTLKAGDEFDRIFHLKQFLEASENGAPEAAIEHLDGAIQATSP